MRKRLTLLRSATAIAGLAGVVALGIAEAEAGAFAIREQSAYSQGASFAGAATCGESIQGAFWNPAVVTCARGLEAESSYSLIMPTAEVTTNPFPGSLLGAGGPLGNFGHPGDIGQDAFVPSSAVGYNFNDSLYFGLTVNAAYGLATKTDYSHAAQYYGRTSEVFSLNAQPVVGYRINDMISVAAGLQVQYFDVRLTQAVPAAAPFLSPTDPTAILKGDDVAFGATAGILFTPMPGTEIGLGYRSRIEHDLEGTLEIPGATPLAISADGITLPDLVSLGVRHQVTDAFTLLGTVEWSNWSEFTTYDVMTPGLPVPVTQLHFEYDDGWFYSLGGEYAYNDQLTLRAGIGWEESPISDRVRSIRLPDNDRLWLSAGMSYDVNDRLKLNAGYSFLKPTDTSINYGPGNPAFETPITFSGEADAQIHIVSVGLKYSFGGAPEPVAAPEPIYKP